MKWRTAIYCIWQAAFAGPAKAAEMSLAFLHTSMWTTFSDWVAAKADLRSLVEVSELFDRAGYNALFNAEIDGLIAQVDAPVIRKELEEAKQMDWVSYISSSLRRSGFQDADNDALTHELTVRLLVEPGSLFRRWRGQPIIARFKTSVKNGIINLAEKRRTRRRRFASGGAVPEDIVARDAPDVRAVEAFRQLVWERLGELGLAVLDLRLSGDGDTKALVGRPELRSPSSYRVKETVKALKDLAHEFAGITGDEELLAKITRARQAERATVRKRFGVAAAVS